jgi:hypothetical protein
VTRKLSVSLCVFRAPSVGVKENIWQNIDLKFNNE